MPPRPEDDIGSLERARERLYEPNQPPPVRPPLAVPGKRAMPHAWEDGLPESPPFRGKRSVRLAGLFFIVSFAFFLVALGVAGYLFYSGGNTVSVDKVTVDIQGPTTVAGGDTVPFSLTITNKNPVAISDATVEVNFPDGTRSFDNVLAAYPRYTENLGTLESGATVTRSVKAVLFGGAGQTLILPVSLSYRTAGSKAVFVKKASYSLSISSTPLSLSVDTLSETVSGQPLTVTLTVRSNAIVPLEHVVVAATLPFGFSVTSTSLSFSNSSFLLGTLAPGATKKIVLTGALLGQDKEERVFRFSVGTARTATNQSLAVAYMTQDSTVLITAPFINTTLALNGDASANAAVSSGSRQSVTVSYINTLSTSVTNATVAITLSGSAVDYDSIQTANGFYRSNDHTIVFSRNTDSSLATLAPGASGVGAFSFATLPASLLPSSPAVTFTISVSGTRVGQMNVPEAISASATKTIKVATAIALSAASLHASGPLANSGPIPPRANQATTYSVVVKVKNGQSSVAGAAVTTTLPSYVSYSGVTSGSGTFSYDSSSRTLTWNVGDLAQGASAQGVFQVSLTPSVSQKGNAPALTGEVSFSGYDRFAGVSVSAAADPVTTETKGDPGYSPTDAAVQ